MRNNILYIGNKLSSKNKNPTTHEALVKALSNEGYKIFSASHLDNKILRLGDMIYSFFRFFYNYELVLIDTYSTQNFWYAVILAKCAKLFKKKYMLILHGGSLEKRFEKSVKVSNKLLKNAHLIISPSPYLKGKIEKMGFSHVEYIPNPFYIEEYHFLSRRELKPNLLWVRAFDEIYNPLMAVKVLELVMKKYPHATLCMVGPAKDASYMNCKNYVQKQNLPVKFTGKLSKSKWTKLAADYDIFLNTTYIDNVPVSVLEAMALGLPVVSTNVGGIPYILKDGHSGMLVPSNNAESMTNVIYFLLENVTAARQLAVNARNDVQKLDWKHIKHKWHEVLT